ncbi:MAG: UDP-N-acetylmuramate--L-alanine ligase [Parvularculaceae bacterium]
MSKQLPFPLGPIHFVGIGGIGMSGIAEVMRNLGYNVQGSDISENANVARLRTLGVPISIGHDAENLGDAAAVVISSAIKDGNPEVAAARSRHIPIVRRADMLAELMRLKWNVCVAGTHGKTTTTSMVAALMDEAGYDPTVINGGIINAYGTNARIGAGDWMVVEADESDGSFLRLPATVAIVTNIDPEHLDHYGDFDSLREAFESFVENTPFYGFGVLCLDHPEVQALVGRVTDRRIVTYGTNRQADMRAEDIRFENGEAIFSMVFRGRDGAETRLDEVRLPMPGMHNVLNALAACVVVREMGANDQVIRRGLARFRGVKRRFTKAGAWRGVTVIDDYGHHPVEIASVLKAAREVAKGKVIAVAQPHRYTRLRDLFDEFCGCFNDADKVLITDVFAAGEEPIEGADALALVAGLSDHGHKGAEKLESWAALPGRIAALAEEGDYVIFLGAGDITKYANGLAKQLAGLDSRAEAAE